MSNTANFAFPSRLFVFRKASLFRFPLNLVLVPTCLRVPVTINKILISIIVNKNKFQDLLPCPLMNIISPCFSSNSSFADSLSTLLTSAFFALIRVLTEKPRGLKVVTMSEATAYSSLCLTCKKSAPSAPTGWFWFSSFVIGVVHRKLRIRPPAKGSVIEI